MIYFGQQNPETQLFLPICYTIEGIVNECLQRSNQLGGQSPDLSNSAVGRANFNHAYDLGGDSASDFAGRIANVAVQPELGLLPEQRLGVGRSNSRDPSADGQDLRNLSPGLHCVQPGS